MNKAYTLTMEARDGYLYARLEGADSYDASLEYWSLIGKKCQELGLRRVLVHENLTGTIDEVEMYEIVTKYMEAGFLGVEVALYDDNPDDHLINALGQMIATNRGALVMLFPTLQEALAWVERD